MDRCKDLSGCVFASCARVRVVLVVIVVLVSPSSVVTEFCGVSPCCSDEEDVFPQIFFFLQKASA